MSDHLKTQFLQRYGGTDNGIATFHAPGRVNLIGEHIDYNGGFVFPAALNIGTTMLARKREDGIFRFASTNFAGMIEMHVSDTSYREQDGWANYAKGVIHHLSKRGYEFSGADISYDGNIPNGSGLSSSASLEVVTGFGVVALEGQSIDKIQLALISQEAENEYVGVNCGIMDQFAVAMGKAQHAILLDCNTLEYEHVPFHAPGYKLIIGNTNKKRGLVDSAYNERRAQCERALEQLQQEHKDLQALCQLTPEQFAGSASLIEDDIVRQRAEHAVLENDRVLQSVKALQHHDLTQFGQLMNASHESLKSLYEVSCYELDVLVEAAQGIDGVLGSRMTGAGFGGCTISLVADERVDRFIEEVGEYYKNKTGIKADFYVCEIGDGVRAWQS